MTDDSGVSSRKKTAHLGNVSLRMWNCWSRNVLAWAIEVAFHVLGGRQGLSFSSVSICFGEKAHMFLSVAQTPMGWNMTSCDHIRCANVRIHVRNVSCPPAAH